MHKKKITFVIWNISIYPFLKKTFQLRHFTAYLKINNTTPFTSPPPHQGWIRNSLSLQAICWIFLDFVCQRKTRTRSKYLTPKSDVSIEIWEEKCLKKTDMKLLSQLPLKATLCKQMRNACQQRITSGVIHKVNNHILDLMLK